MTDASAPRAAASTAATPSRRALHLVGAAAGGALAGAAARGALPPFVLDDPFWRQFLAGPPMAGLFAVVAAAIAFAAARIGVGVQRQGAERDAWWARAEWALDLARSDRHVERMIGLRALEGLRDDATRTEAMLILAVTEAVTRDDVLDTARTPPDNGRRRWARWPKRSG